MLCRCFILELVDGLCDVSWEGDVDMELLVVPIYFQTTVE